MTAPYHQSEAEQAIDIIDLADLEAAARQIIPEGGFGYISGGSEDEWTLRQNTLAFNHRQIVPRMLADIEQPDLSTEFLGIALKTPIMMAPCAAQGLAHVRGEMATAEGVAAAGALMAQSTYSSTSIAQTAAAAPGAPQLFQLYLSKDWDFNHYLLDEAVKAGARAIIMTVDSTLGGYREADLRTRFKFPLPMANLVQFSGGDGTGKNIAEIYAQAAQRIGTADVQKVAAHARLPVIVKGIQCGDDAELAMGAGAAAVYVSNHGGRQLNGGPASFDVLPEVARAVNGKVPVIFDSGIRHGSHAFKALASGADLVALARPVMYGLALGGAQGVRAVIEHLNKELRITMQLAGTRTLAEVKRARLLDLRY